VIENATIFSAKDTPVHVAAQELTSGGVLIEVSDSGVGIPEARLAEMNWRLDNPPVMDVSVSRHMGLFAVARLAERHGVRVRLRPRSPHGLTALVWLPDSVTEREGSLYGARSRTFAAQPSFQGRGNGGLPARSIPEVQPANHRRDVIVPEHAADDPRETAPAAPAVPAAPAAPAVTGATGATAATSDWFRSRPSPGAGTNGSAAPATAAASTTMPLDRRDPSYPPPGPVGPATGPAAVPTGGTDGWAAGKHAAQIIAEPVRGEYTAAGLPTRVPQANLIPGSAGGERTGAGAGAGRPGSGPGAPENKSPRSADVARDRLSGFQRGVRRAKGPSPSSPDSPQGAE
jgi:hypothetical protein